MSETSSVQASSFDERKAAIETWEAMLSVGAFVEGEVTFASGLHATLKVDAEKLYEHPKELAIVMGHFAVFPHVQNADVLLYVPDGMKQFMTKLGEELQKPVANTIRRPGATSKYDFIFQTQEDQELALSAKTPLIGEDVVTTLGSVAGLRKLLRPDQPVHSLAMLLRGEVNPDYRTGLEDHYLLIREIPTDKYEFRRRLQGERF
jgi:hypothetical protein